MDAERVVSRVATYLRDGQCGRGGGAGDGRGRVRRREVVDNWAKVVVVEWAVERWRVRVELGRRVVSVRVGVWGGGWCAAAG